MAKRYILTAPPTHPDGMLLGEEATDKVGFFGATPVVRPAHADQAAVAAGAVANAAGANPTQAEFNAAVARINALTILTNRLRLDAVTLGLLKGAA